MREFEKKLNTSRIWYAKYMDAAKRHGKKVVVGLAGGLLLVVGIVAIPYPGPGWLIVFAALAILATEFEWAGRILHFARGKYDAWQHWLAVQSAVVRALFWCATAIVVVLTVWLLNGYGFMCDILGLDWPWVHSPLPIFAR